MTSRRIVLTALSWLVAPAYSIAQRRPHRMAYLSFGSFALNARYQAALLRQLAERGYHEGRNLVIERRSADGDVDRLPGLVGELLALKPDLLFVTGSQGALAASRATKTVPIVFVAVSDPVGMGIVRTLARPESNATGVTNQADEFHVKVLQLLKEVFPSAARVSVLHDPDNLPLVRALPALLDAATALALELRIVHARSARDLDAAFDTVQSQRPDALYVLGAALFSAHRRIVVDLVSRHRLPAVYGLTDMVDAGGLMSYSFSMLDQYRAAAVVIDHILRGVLPAELPVEQPTRFELVLNLKTAKAQGISFPRSVLLRADRLIDV